MKRTSKPVIENIRISFDVNIPRLQAGLQTKHGRIVKRQIAELLLHEYIKIQERRKRSAPKNKK